MGLEFELDGTSLGSATRGIRVMRSLRCIEFGLLVTGECIGKCGEPDT